MKSHFFAYLARMKLIARWGLMRNTYSENVAEHSLQVAQVAHALALIKNKFFSGNVDANQVAVLALYHDASEVVTGDLPTPVKYFNSQIQAAYKEIETRAEDQLVELLPEALRADYRPLISQKNASAEAVELVKAADSICAYLKCIEEKTSGNSEFSRAEKSIEDKIKNMNKPEVAYFLEHFVPSFKLTLDELRF